MKHFLIVCLGGGLGSGLRYMISLALNKKLGQFPFGTFLVNIIGCLLIGFLISFSEKNNYLSQNQMLLLATGFCGGFTTFSTFSYESMQLIKSSDYFLFFLYIIGSVVLGLLAVLFGIYIARYFN